MELLETDKPLLEKLHPNFKTVLLATEGKEYADAVVALGWKLGTVKSRLSRARKALLALRAEAAQ